VQFITDSFLSCSNTTEKNVHAHGLLECLPVWFAQYFNNDKLISLEAAKDAL